MPAGKTHDKITWLCIPPVLALSWWISHDLKVCAGAALSFAFAGLMFSGDLDVKSVQYKRWGWFKWIWLPYQRLVSHRSPFSHGPVLGALTRLLYVSLWFVILFLLWSWLAHSLEQQELVQQSLHGIHSLGGWFKSQPQVLAASLSGLWLGGLSHTLADELGSFWKRRKRKKASKKRGARQSKVMPKKRKK